MNAKIHMSGDPESVRLIEWIKITRRKTKIKLRLYDAHMFLPWHMNIQILNKNKKRRELYDGIVVPQHHRSSITIKTDIRHTLRRHSLIQLERTKMLCGKVIESYDFYN